MHKITSPDQYFDKFVSDLELPPSALKEVYRLWALIADFEEEWQDGGRIAQPHLPSIPEC